ncbi:MAG: septum formation initiator family protein [Bacteroidaceae bacterium]|nr:septum formation initiator family protein [Bacteroidaceae bacterium]
MMNHIKNFIVKFKYVITLIVFGILIGFVGEHSLVERHKQRQEINELQNEIDKYNTKFEKDKELLLRLKNNPEAIKDVAREKYFMKKENEDIFIIEDEKQ